jgi:DMSO/TMAO reductase YedYZ molybdopterin-dependent catalytic subunit
MDELVSRRDLLRAATRIAGGAVLIGCDVFGSALLTPASAAESLKGGKLVENVPFTGEGHDPVDTAFGLGLDGRLFTDLSALSPESLITPVDKFYIRTRCPDQIDYSTPWTVQINGLVAQPSSLSQEQLKARTKDMGIHLMECSGNPHLNHFGMLSACRWSGVPITQIFELAQPKPESTYILVSGFDKHSRPSRLSTAGASWIFTREQLETSKAFLATEMNGSPLTRDHGYPVRLFVPGWYGCTCIKWVNEISFIDKNAPATSQMREFASRTHQDGNPPLACMYKPSTIDQSAMPVRIEKWLVDGKIKYNIVGVMWGGARPTNKLAIRFNPNEEYVRVDHCHQPQSNATWSLWSHIWEPHAPGPYQIRLKVLDPSIPTKRLDMGFYTRTTQITEV